MLLRRITQHVKNQNWFAVFLDFVIVVVGVFIGIQVANWNERLNDQERAINYYERLSQEMNINRETLIKRQDSYAQQINYGRFALNSSSKPLDNETAWPIIRAFFQASHAFPITQRRGTYDEIISTGDLALLKDQELINMLSEFYTFSGYSTIQIIPSYRENVRRIIPFDLQRYFQTRCYEVLVPDIHRLLDCPPPEKGGNLIELAVELQSNQQLKNDLRYMMSYADVSASMARNIIDFTENILNQLSKNSHKERGE